MPILSNPHSVSALASVFGIGAACGLCAVFVGVVQGAVSQGDASRRATAMLMEASWRCRALPSRAARDRCLQRYHDEKPGDSAGVRLLVTSTLATPLDAAR